MATAEMTQQQKKICGFKETLFVNKLRRKKEKNMNRNEEKPWSNGILSFT